MMSLLSKFADDNGVLLVDFVESMWGWNLPPSTEGDKHIFFRGADFTVPYSTLKMLDGVTYARVGGAVVCYEGGGWREAQGVDYDAMAAPGVVTESFVTVLHNPPNVPEWFDYENSPQQITLKRQFVDSLRYCEGIFVFSQYLKDWLLNTVGVPCPVNVLFHPTEDAETTWEFGRFIEGGRPAVVQVGYWLRRLHAIYTLSLPQNYRRVWLYGNRRAFDLLAREAEEEGIDGHLENRVEALRLEDSDFDDLLSRSLVLVDVYDSSCNNAIIECVVRHTPALVRRIPATEEYLGVDYPLFFDTPAEASAKARDLAAIVKAHRHMRGLHAGGAFSGERFLRDFESSFIFRKVRGLPRITPHACVSLGVDCFPRAMLTKFGYKRKRSDGELSTPFDLAYHHPGVVIDMIRSDFARCWEARDLYVNQDGIIMHRNGSMYNHESDTDDKRRFFADDGFRELRERYERRAESFRELLGDAEERAKQVVFVNVGNAYPTDLREAIAARFPGLDFHILTINILYRSSTYRDTMPNVEFGSEEAEANRFSFYNVRRPTDGYVWYDAADFSTDEGRDFEAQVEDVFSRVMHKVRPAAVKPTSYFLEEDAG